MTHVRTPTAWERSVCYSQVARAARGGWTPVSPWTMLAALLVVSHIGLQSVFGDDWPQWRGPRRDAVSRETGLLQAWPAEGPPLVWEAAELGSGYSSVVIEGGRAITIGKIESDVIVTALDAATGKRLWTRKIGESTRTPSSTPTLDGDRLFALDPDGDLYCLQSATGEVIWHVNLSEDLHGRMMSGRGYGESPLVDGDRLICTPGGPDTAFVAFDKHTGQVIWQTQLPELGPLGKEGAGFSSIVLSEAGGRRQYVQLFGRGLVGIDARDGKYLWSFNGISNDTANIPTPLVHDDLVFAANGYTAGSVLLKLAAAPDAPAGDPNIAAQVVYTLNGSQFQNHHGGVLRLGDHVYGGHGNNNGLPTCLELATGRVLWKRRGPGVGSAAILAADGQLYFRFQNGVVALIAASPDGYRLNGTLEIPGAGGDSWAHPALAQGRLFLREQEHLFVYDVRAQSPTADSVADTRPLPTSNATVAELRRRGVAVDPLQASLPKRLAASSALRPVYDYARRPSDTGGPLTPLVVTLGAEQLSPAGLPDAELVSLLGELPAPLIINLAGTKVTTAGLARLTALEVVGLNLELCSQIADESLAGIDRFRELRVLVLSSTGVSPDGLRHLAELPHLVALDLELCDQITDAACEPLGALRQLKSLVFKKSGFEKQRISDAGLKQLARLSDLEVLNLYGNSVTDAGLPDLAPFEKLRDLNLSLLPITDQGLARLPALKSLRQLDLLFSEGFAGPTITDDGLIPLQRLTGLVRLNLTGAQLTDAGLTHLEPLQNLRTLVLARTRVTGDGEQNLRTILPQCQVLH